MKSASPMPMGARKVALCLTAASMMTAKHSCVVVNISMKQPRAIEVSPPSRTFTAMGPGSVAETAAAAEIAPRI